MKFIHILISKTTLKQHCLFFSLSAKHCRVVGTGLADFIELTHIKQLVQSQLLENEDYIYTVYI